MGLGVRRFVERELMRLSVAPLIGRLCMRMAAALRGPYKDRRVLANLTPHSFVSPKAQISCPRLTLGPHCFIDDDVVIYAHADGGEVCLGEAVHVYRGTIIEIGRGGSVTVGAHTHIQSHCNIKGFLGSTRIGAHVQIAPHCGFSPYEHGLEDLDMGIREQDITSSGDIVVGNNAWLGLHVQVLDGVNIGAGSVVGAGAVVTRDLPPNCVAAGVPARVFRHRGTAAP